MKNQNFDAHVSDTDSQPPKDFDPKLNISQTMLTVLNSQESLLVTSDESHKQHKELFRIQEQVIPPEDFGLVMAGRVEELGISTDTELKLSHIINKKGDFSKEITTLTVGDVRVITEPEKVLKKRISDMLLIAMMQDTINLLNSPLSLYNQSGSMAQSVAQLTANFNKQYVDGGTMNSMFKASDNDYVVLAMYQFIQDTMQLVQDRLDKAHRLYHTTKNGKKYIEGFDKIYPLLVQTCLLACLNALDFKKGTLDKNILIANANHLTHVINYKIRGSKSKVGWKLMDLFNVETSPYFDGSAVEHTTLPPVLERMDKIDILGVQSIVFIPSFFPEYAKYHPELYKVIPLNKSLSKDVINTQIELFAEDLEKLRNCINYIIIGDLLPVPIDLNDESMWDKNGQNVFLEYMFLDYLTQHKKDWVMKSTNRICQSTLDPNIGLPTIGTLEDCFYSRSSTLVNTTGIGDLPTNFVGIEMYLAYTTITQSGEDRKHVFPDPEMMLDKLKVGSILCSVGLSLYKVIDISETQLTIRPFNAPILQGVANHADKTLELNEIFHLKRHLNEHTIPAYCLVG